MWCVGAISVQSAQIEVCYVRFIPLEVYLCAVCGAIPTSLVSSTLLHNASLATVNNHRVLCDYTHVQVLQSFGSGP